VGEQAVEFSLELLYHGGRSELPAATKICDPTPQFRHPAIPFGKQPRFDAAPPPRQELRSNLPKPLLDNLLQCALSF